MAKTCLYFQIHQPWRLKPLSIFDIDSKNDYFEVPENLDFENGKVMKKVAEKSYRPMLTLLEKLMEKEDKFKFSVSITGVAVEQMERYTPDLLGLLERLAKTGRVEFLSETYYHSLSSLYSPTEFILQVSQHKRMIEDRFGITPKVFRNTELIYTNNVAKLVQDMGYKAMLAEGTEKVIGRKSPTKIFHSPSGLPLLLKHYKLSDDVAFRFSDSHRSDKPLTAETFAHWINSSYPEDEVVNLFMDFETFGEHQWEDTGIFRFFEHFVSHNIATGGEFVLPSEAIKVIKKADIYSSDSPVSWADVDRDITAWRGNSLQEDTLTKIYALETQVMASKDDQIISDWRKMQTSDHFYYMCTKWANDGDVHAYFSPYGSPFQAYSNFNNAFTDLKLRIVKKNDG